MTDTASPLVEAVASAERALIEHLPPQARFICTACGRLYMPQGYINPAQEAGDD